MPSLDVLDTSGKKVKEIKAPDEVLAFPLKEHLIYETVVSHRANQRRGTACTKTRSDVRGGGRKPWRQKGTGRARVGSTRSPLWRKGGTTFGPQPRDYTTSLPKKAKQSALKSVLSMKYAEKKLVVVETPEFEAPKTKDAAKFLNGLKIGSALVVDSHGNKPLFLSLRNLPGVKAVAEQQITVHDVLNHEWLVISPAAFASLMEKLK